MRVGLQAFMGTRAGSLILSLGIVGAAGTAGTWSWAARAATESSPDEAALMRVCSLETTPTGNPLDGSGNVRQNWRWEKGNRQYDYQFSARRHSSAPFSNPVCERFILQRLAQQSGKDDVKERCESIRNDLYYANQDLEGGSSSADGSAMLNAGDTFLRGNTGKGGGDDDHLNACERDSVSGDDQFACSFLDFQKRIESSTEKKPLLAKWRRIAVR